MSAMSYLHKHPKTGMYWFWRAVPKALQKTIGRTTIKKTLGTKDVGEAKRLCGAMAAETERLFNSAKAGVDLTLAEAEQWARVWQVSEEAKAKEHWLAQGPMDDDDREALSNVLDDRATELDERLLSHRWDAAVVAAARALLLQHGLALSEGTQGYHRLCHAVTKAAIRIETAKINWNKGDWTSTAADAQHVVVAPSLSPLVTTAPRTTRRRSDGSADATLNEVLTRWARESKPRPKTLHEWKMSVRRFNEVVGVEKAARDVTKQDAVAFKDAMLAMPRVLTAAQRKKGVQAILKETEGDLKIVRVAPTTVAKHFAALNSLMAYAKRNGLAEGNPFEGVKPSDPNADREKRLPFSADDLRAIFSSPLYSEATSRDAKFWLPLLCLYTGARLDELGQLLVADVRIEDGVTYLDLNTIGEGKHIKNKGSRRKVPVHPELVRVGFLRYVSGLKKRGERQVFPELAPDNRGVWTGALSKWLNRYLDGIGINDPRKVIHSFRHTFKDACRKARIAESVHDALTGHTNGSVGRSYGSGEPLDVLAEAVAKISYPVDLKGLHRG